MKINSISIFWFAKPYNTWLWVDALAMLFKNIDPNGSLYNGTRLHITQMANNVLKVKVITGNRVGEKVLIPKIVIIPSALCCSI